MARSRAANERLRFALERATVRMENAAKVYNFEPDQTQWREWAAECRAALSQ